LTHARAHTQSPHTPWTYLALPKVHPVLLLRLARVLLLHHHLPAQVHFPTYLALPSLPRGPSCHIRWSLPSSAPRTFTPHTPSPAPYQQGNLVLQPGDCCLLILQRLCIKWWGGGLVCVSVCVCARALSHACMHRRMWAHTAHADTRRHTHSGPCPCWDATQASGLSLARKKRRLSVESMGNPRPQAQCSSLNDSARTSPRGSVTRQGLQSLDLAMKQLSLPFSTQETPAY